MQFGGPSGTLVRPYIRGGATFLDDPDFVLLASFEGSPSSVGPLRISTKTDDVVADISAGLDVIGADGTSFRLFYEVAEAASSRACQRHQGQPAVLKGLA